MRQQIKNNVEAATNRGENKAFENALLGDKFALGARKACLSTPQLSYSSLHLSFERHKHRLCYLIVRGFSHLKLLKDPCFALKIFGLFILLLLKVKLRIGSKPSAHYPRGVLQWVLGSI